ncbi:ABC transporter substrate-binding protein [Actinomadura harenae]|uniref:ABC transporter substrate-binding protein n=1 Tax=Actinomadura harenae TaxID=2483351 RepID=UPI0018F6748F|nr:ABC transporter substrate-binding protein [Actinomadura harenae]
MPRALRASALALVLLAAACDSGGSSGGGTGFALSPSTPSAKGDIASFSWGLYAEPPGLDYATAFDYPQNEILSNVCESLMRWTPQLTLEPGLAQEVRRPDPLTFVYRIRPGVRFHGGGTVTADDVVHSLNRHRDPAVGSTWVSAFEHVASIAKSGPLEVTVKLKSPDALFPQWMATSAGTVASARSLKSEGTRFGTPDGKVDCTGPFTLGRWNKGHSIEVDRFDGYWGRRARSGKVIFKIITDENARTNALLNGDTDGGYLLNPNSYAKLKGGGGLYFGRGATTVNLNVTNLKGTLGDVRVRKALSLALDRKGFVKAGLQGNGVPTSSLVTKDVWPQGVDGGTGLPSPETDIAAARRLVQDAGAVGRTVTVATSQIGPDVSLLATAVQAAGTRIGLKVDLRTVAPDAFTALFSDPKAREGIDAFPETYYLSVTDPLSMYRIFRTGQFENYQGFSDPAYDRAVDAADTEYDPVKRARLTQEVQRLESRQYLWIPVAEYPMSLFLNKRITGAPTSIAFMYYPWAADVGAAR